MQRKWKMAAIGLGILLMTLTLATGAGAKTRGNLYGDKVNYYKNEDYFVCEGNARLEYKDYVITAETVQYYQKEEKAIFQGEVVVVEGKNRITGQKMTAYLKKDEFVIEGEVYIYYIRKEQEEDRSPETAPVDESADTQASPEGDEGKDKIVQLWAKHVVYTSGDDDHLIATDAVTMEMEEDTIKADFLEYKGGEEIVYARGNVEVLGEDEERITCNDFTYRIEGEDEGFDADGQVKLEFNIDDEEDEDDEETSPLPAEEGEIVGQPDEKSDTTPANE